MIKGILIDLGNTIVYNKNFDFNKGLQKIYNLAINKTITYLQFQNFNKHLRAITYDNRGEFEFKLIDYLNFIISYFDLKFNISLSDLEIEFAKACEELEVIPGIRKILMNLKKQNMKIVVLSNTSFSKRAILAQLMPLNIIQYIDEFVVSSEYIFRKPHHLFFEMGIKKLNLNRENILYIGNDYEVDIIGGVNAGLKVCWFNELHHKNYQNLQCINIDNYNKLFNYLEGLK